MIGKKKMIGEHEVIGGKLVVGESSDISEIDGSSGSDFCPPSPLSGANTHMRLMMSRECASARWMLMMPSGHLGFGECANVGIRGLIKG